MLQALMGPSGAGKSTLMDILAQRKTVGYLSGFLLVNGEPATQGFVRNTAYVPQVRMPLCWWCVSHGLCTDVKHRCSVAACHLRMSCTVRNMLSTAASPVSRCPAAGQDDAHQSKSCAAA